MRSRCFDCLVELGDADRFVVLKELPLTRLQEALSDDPFVAALERCREVLLCAECAGWYEDAIPITAVETE